MVFHEFLVIEVLDNDISFHLILLGDGEDILDSPTATGLSCFRDFERAQPVAAPGLREQEQIVVRIGHEHVLDEVFIARFASPCPAATAGLLAELCHGGPFDIAQVGDGNGDLFFLDEVFHTDFALGHFDLGTAGIGVVGADLGQFVFDDGALQLFAV